MTLRLPPPEPDRLAGTLKPLSPKVFEVETPEQMAKAIVEIEKALSSEGRPSR